MNQETIKERDHTKAHSFREMKASTLKRLILNALNEGGSARNAAIILGCCHRTIMLYVKLFEIKRYYFSGTLFKPVYYAKGDNDTAKMIQLRREKLKKEFTACLKRHNNIPLYACKEMGIKQDSFRRYAAFLSLEYERGKHYRRPPDPKCTFIKTFKDLTPHQRKEKILAALNQGKSQTKTAAILGISRRTLMKLMNAFDVSYKTVLVYTEGKGYATSHRTYYSRLDKKKAYEPCSSGDRNQETAAKKIA